jgi:EAL domain-containing protein (putative c-di-GMP-specific phosphodiesterase class I)
VVAIYDESPTGRAGPPFDIGENAAELGRLLKQGRIRSEFQPIVELDTGLTVAYEALARGPEGSPLKLADQLFAAARQCGRLTELDRVCQNTAMEAALRADLTGSWTNSLALLPFVRPDVIKLDLSLIQTRPSAEIAEIFSAVNAEAEWSGAAVLAEGIESRDHLYTARSLGATLGQGWLFGRPGLPPKSIAPPAASTVRTIRRGPEASTETPFALAAAAVPPRSASKGMLIEISKHLERQAMRSGEATAVLATFQEAAFFTPDTRRRYRQLARGAAFVGVLGRGMPLAPMPGICGGHLSPADPLLSEWDIAVIGPHFASCLTARDLGDSGPDLQRRFEFVLSHNRELAIKVATALFSRIARKP